MLNLYWSTVLLLVLAPILSPFFIVIWFVFLLEVNGESLSE